MSLPTPPGRSDKPQATLIPPSPLAGLDAATSIASEAQRIATSVTEGGLDAQAVRLGRWRVRDIVQHLEGVHAWANRILHSASMAGPGHTKSKLDGHQLITQFETGATELSRTIQVTPADATCPNFNPGTPPTAQFWHRRQLHETTIHRWDVERALGVDTTLDQHVAIDGIDEYLDVWIRTRGKQTLLAPLTLRTSTAGWTLRPAERPGRVEITPGIDGDAAAELSGRADELLLVLWGRFDIGDTCLERHGDRDVIASLRRH